MSNILFITMDQLSLHALSCYGAPVSRTPAIDSLSTDGVTFQRCYTPCALCTPARASILTGLYPHAHGALHNAGIMIPFSESEIGSRLTTLPEILDTRGYSLGYQGKWHAGIARTANDLGFEGFGPPDYGHYKESPRFKDYLREHDLEPVEEIIEFRAQSETNWMDTSGYVRGDIRATGSYFLTGETIRMVDDMASRESPFFMWLSYWGPHAPYWPHESYLDYYPPTRIPQWLSFDEPSSNKPMVHKRYRESVMPHATAADWNQWSVIISRYYALTRMIDDQIGRLIEHLKHTGLYDEMTIIFAADHGDSLGVHGGVFDKGPMAYEQMYHIPLIIKPPRGEQSVQTDAGFVSLLDLAPTIWDFADADGPTTDGRSLRPLLTGATNGRPDDFLAEFHGHRFPVGQRIVWWSDYKYILNFADTDELYNVSDDPEELTNLIDDESVATIRSELRRRMLRQLHEHGDNLHPQAYRLLHETTGG